MLSVQTPRQMRWTVARAHYASWAELGDLAARDWLSPREREQWQRARHPQRRREWLAGRLIAKQLLAEIHPRKVEPQEIEILPGTESLRPRIWVSGRPYRRSLSISHSARGVLVAMSDQTDRRVGADLVERAPLGSSFRRLWFTPEENQWLAEISDPFAANRLWATKEAIYKACNRGEGFDPRRIGAVAGACRYGGSLVPCGSETFEIDDQIAVLVAIQKSDIPSFHQPLQEIYR